jgi:hypothetical protein
MYIERTMNKRIFLLVSAIVGIFCVYPFYARAEIGIAIAPLVFEMTGTPGETISNQVRVTNKAQTITEIKMSAENVGPSDEEGHVAPEETSSYSLASWVSIDPQSVVLGPEESVWVDFKITVPANAEPGGHYGTILAAGSVVASDQPTGATIIPRVGSVLLVTVPGSLTEKLNVLDFTAPKYSEYGPINFEMKFQNEGTVHVKPSGVITVTNWLGQKVAAIPFPEKNILPGAARKIEASLGQHWLWAGKYTATLTGNYGISNSQLSPAVITFWAFPWKFGILILVAILLLLLARKRLIGAFKILMLGDRKR